MASSPVAGLAAGLRLAFTTLTVLPLRPGPVDRRVAAVAMTAAPLVGAALGAIVGLVLVLAERVVPAAVAAGLATAAAVVLTRGLHLDGLADTVDALGSYRRGDAALEVMKRPDIGPFGVAAVVLVLLLQTATLGGVSALAPTVLAIAAGRLAVPVACRRGVPPARPEGLGALVTGTVPLPAAATAAVLVGAAAVWTVPGRPWQGPLAVAAAVGVAMLLVRHAVRRFGGITGDVIGAAVELSTTAALLVLVAGSAG